MEIVRGFQKFELKPLLLNLQCLFFLLQEAAINSLIAAEIGFCFFIGECIGKGSLVGYQIPGAVHFSAEF